MYNSNKTQDDCVRLPSTEEFVAGHGVFAKHQYETIA